MVVGKTDNDFVGRSNFENTGTITINGTESGGITLLDTLPNGAINKNKIEIINLI